MRAIYDNERGAALAVGLIFIAVLAVLSTTAMTVTTTNVLISGNYKSTVRTFHGAEAGTEETRARLRATAANPITDAHPTSTTWRAYVGSASQAAAKGYDTGNGQHVRVNSLQNTLSYTVEVQHATAGGNILYWGDDNQDGVNTRNTTSGQNIYLITGYGTSGDINKTVEIEAARIPPLTVPGALYVEAQTTVQGSSTNIIGTDDCGSDDQPGIRTTLPATLPDPPEEESVQQNGSPNITGSPTPIAYNSTNLNIQEMVNAFKVSADFKYTVTSATHTGSTTPGPGDNWGTPTPGATLQDASSCSATNIVHYDTGGTYIKLSGGVTGCGFLLIEGDVEIHGGFSWYGVLLITGSVIFTGGGNKNITGAVLSGGSAIADVIGGNANIVYCSDAVTNQTQSMPLRVLSWREP
jgi:Tfp pilus assembly protein PilX